MSRSGEMRDHDNVLDASNTSKGQKITGGTELARSRTIVTSFEFKKLKGSQNQSGYSGFVLHTTGARERSED